MSRWYRVFGRGEEQPPPEALLEHLRGLGVMGSAHFRGDDDGWTSFEIAPSEGTPPLLLECYLSSEPDIRSELNTWAAWLETCEEGPHHLALMERVIQTKQLYTLLSTLPGADDVRDNLCRFLARTTDGVYHVDGEGFFAADGTLLLREP